MPSSASMRLIFLRFFWFFIFECSKFSKYISCWFSFLEVAAAVALALIGACLGILSSKIHEEKPSSAILAPG